MILKYLVIFEKTGAGYSAYVPDLPGCISTGHTKKEAEKNIYKAIEFHLEGLQSDGIEILPEANSESETLLLHIS